MIYLNSVGQKQGRDERMSDIVNRLKSYGIEHQDNAPTLEVRDVSVIYSGGSNGATTPSGQKSNGKHAS